MAIGSRRNGREYALKILYSLYDQEEPIEQVLSSFWQNFYFAADVLGEPAESVTAGTSVPDDVVEFTEQLVLGVYENLEEIDKILVVTSKHWALDRMPRLDLSLLRLACYELLWTRDTPAGVVINEAIEVAKRYGSKDSPSFLNGVLDKVAKQVNVNK